MACNIFSAGKNFIYLQSWMEKSKGSCFCLSFILFVDSHLLYVHITCSPVNTSFHSCSLYFVCSHIQTNRIDGENDGVLTAAVEEGIQRYMIILLFHISLIFLHVPTKILRIYDKLFLLPIAIYIYFISIKYSKTNKYINTMSRG